MKFEVDADIEIICLSAALSLYLKIFDLSEFV
jgi:hypothetical protein